MKPSSFPEVTPKVHFAGFNLSWNFRNLLNNLSRLVAWSSVLRAFTIISSTYTSTSLCIISWKRVTIAR
ncbi:Uncharacterized protein TCM_014080 [Theobroma cacao]|uniref:Uncharacterized protein n=1 Tax=Theobroma cacao TaxID=3641 RepID=A0A061G4E5_THECC|nr:Uncharacterized protein TCM_014080 [Theobroma cacao]